MHICMYIHYALWLYQTPSLFFLLLFESPNISPSIVPHSSQPCQDINNLFPSIQLDISCLPLWVRPSNLLKV